MTIFWISKGQKGVTLSSSEAKYVVYIRGCKRDMIYLLLIVKSGISVTLPIVVQTDNISAFFMAENASSGVQTRHIDTRCHFICENIKDGFITKYLCEDRGE